ncbi:MAG: hypothetical protein GTO18_02310 [Anaerolineales bacterium]|nr:hypothetical protein [Anaerolineales bacterium]
MAVGHQVEESQVEAIGTEPTVLDWFISLFRFNPIAIPPLPDDHVKEKESHSGETSVELEFDLPPFIEDVSPYPEVKREPISSLITLKHFRFPAALLLALFAQLGLEAKPEDAPLVVISVLIYAIAIFLIGWATWEGDFRLDLPKESADDDEEAGVRPAYLGIGAVLALLTFLFSRRNEFTFLNLTFWFGSLICLMTAFWEGESPFLRFWRWLKSAYNNPPSIRIDRWTLLVLGCIVVVIFFRVTKIDEVPMDMWSDQAEKLLDVSDVLEGKPAIFFIRNTGREAIQFYLAALTANVLDTGISFITLKVGTVLIGLLTLPFLYLFAKEYGGRYVGLAAVFLAGVAYWPNVISRLGLRFPLYPLFVAPAFYLLVRGLRRGNRNDFLLMGVAIGLGLHGYSPARVIPLAVFVGVIIYMLHSIARGHRTRVFTWLVLAGVIAFAVFIPLFSVALEFPDLYLDRMLTRMTELEVPYPESPIVTFFKNQWNAFTMFNWDDGEIWVVSIPHRAVLDWVTGAFFHLGLIISFVRYLKMRRWEDLFLLISIPILMFPSSLSLAFPNENPAPNRASGAIVPAFTIAATTLALIPQWIRETWQNRWVRVAFAVAPVLMLLFIARENYRLVFEEFAPQSRAGVWNTREVADVVEKFANSFGDYDTVHVIPYPYWLDTRLVATIAGVPGVDYGVWPDELEDLPSETRPQLFIFKPEDDVALARLQELYPRGSFKRYVAEVEGKDFMVYFVPSSVGLESIPIEPES